MMQDKDGIDPPSAAGARGFGDLEPDAATATERVLRDLASACDAAGYVAVDTPVVERAEALGGSLPDTDRPNGGVFAFDDGEDRLALRYDLTAPLARYVAQRRDALRPPMRLRRSGAVFRNEKPGPGRWRQFLQFDADLLGPSGPSADAEAVLLMADALDATGLDGGFAVRLGDRRILEGLLSAVGLAPDDPRRAAVLRSLDKLDRLGPDGVGRLLGEGRTDGGGGRGDFTPGVGLEPRVVDRLLAAVSGGLEAMRGEAGSDPSAAAGFEAVEGILATCAAMGRGGQVVFDPSVVRGLDYYTGPVFEAVAADASVGSVAGGGRYDGLLSRFGGEPLPAVGFSVGVTRLASLLPRSAVRPVRLVVASMGAGDVASAMLLARDVRDGLASAGLRRPVSVEAFPDGAVRLGRQLRWADDTGAAAVLIRGEEERSAGVVQVKDLALGRSLAGAASNSEWRGGRLAQTTVPLGDVVGYVAALVRRRLDG